MIPDTGMALLIQEEKCFLDNIYLKVISFTYNCFHICNSQMVSLKKVQKQTTKLQLCQVLLNEAEI